jgi:hypothetical protein
MRNPSMNRKMLLACVAAGVAVATSAPFTPGAGAAATTTATPGFTAPGGVVRLEATPPPPGSTIKGARVALYANTTDTTPIQTVPFVLSNKCQVTNLAQISTLLDISVTGAKSTGVYLVDNGLGNFTNAAGCNSNTGRLAAGGSIVLKPGSSVTGKFVSAKVNIEAKFNAALGYSATNNGTTVTSGTNPLSLSSDSAPDAGAKDNNIVTIDPTTPATATSSAVLNPFDTLTLTETTATGTIALDNGGDALDNRPSEFFLGQSQDFSVNCTDQNTVQANVTGGQNTTAFSATFERLANGFNAAKDPTCFKIGVTFQIQAGAVLVNGVPHDVVYLNSTNTSATGVPQEVRANVTIVWKVNRYDAAGNLRSQASIADELQREINYTNDLTSFQPVQWCGHLLPPASPGFASEPQHPVGQPWCLTSDESHIEGDFIIQTQVYHGQGDPKWGL